MRFKPALLLCAMLPFPGGAADPKAETPPLHKVKASPFKVEVKLDGVFAPKVVHEIQLRPKTWAEWTVFDGVDHGAAVKKGDVLVRLDPEKIDRKIHDGELDLELSRLDVEIARADLQFAEQIAPLDLAGVERAYRNVKEDLERYLKVDQPLDIKSTQLSLTNAVSFLAYSEEELKQLKKMYAADDVTEETEEIVLRRAQDAVDRARHSLERAKTSTTATLNFSIPREETAKKEGEARKQLELVKTKSTSAASLKKKQLALDKLVVQHDQAKEAFANLKADRALMTLKAPADGVVYYGSFDRGQWSGSKAIGSKLRKDSKLLSNTVFLTLVEPRPMRIQTQLAEKDLRAVKAGASGHAAANAEPDRKLPVKVESVSAVPSDGGKFDITLSVDLGASEAYLMPGMGCQVILGIYENKQALTVPAQAVFAEGDAKIVHLKAEKGFRPQTVQTGRTADGKTEILKGLKAGDEIFLEKQKSE